MKFFILSTIALLLAIDMPTSLGYFDELRLLCKDANVSDEKLTSWTNASKKCLDEYRNALQKVYEIPPPPEKDDCEQVSTYVNEKVKLPNNKRLMSESCSAEYSKCYFKVGLSGAPPNPLIASKEHRDVDYVSLKN